MSVNPMTYEGLGLDKVDKDCESGDDCREKKVDVVKEAIHDNANDLNDGEGLDGMEKVVVNPDEDTLDRLASSLLDREEEHGEFICPCRYVDEDRDNSDIVCPCEYALKEIEETGSCTCNMYFSSKEVDDFT